jgi:hypothetical protein
MLQETSSDIVLVNWNMVVAVDASAGPVQVTLPQAVNRPGRYRVELW